MLHAPKDDVALVVFGTTDTANTLNDADPDCYLNVTAMSEPGPVPDCMMSSHLRPQANLAVLKLIANSITPDAVPACCKLIRA